MTQGMLAQGSVDPKEVLAQCWCKAVHLNCVGHQRIPKKTNAKNFSYLLAPFRMRKRLCYKKLLFRATFPTDFFLQGLMVAKKRSNREVAKTKKSVERSHRMVATPFLATGLSSAGVK